MLLEMKVVGLAIDGQSNMPYVVLENKEKNLSFPIWIGMFEASAIATEMEGIKVARPMTHDLLRTVVSELGAELVRVEITELKENTYYAALLVRGKDGKVSRVDSRPSDAIAMALRAGAVIMVEEAVAIKSSRAMETGKWRKAQQAQGGQKKPNWEEILKSLSDEAFGKYKM